MNSDEFKARRNKVKFYITQQTYQKEKVKCMGLLRQCYLEVLISCKSIKKAKHSEYILKIQNIFVLLISSSTICKHKHTLV